MRILYNSTRLFLGGLQERTVLSREAAGVTLPPMGLCLEWIRYEG